MNPNDEHEYQLFYDFSSYFGTDNDGQIIT